MLRRIERNGCAIYLSPLLERAGVPHAFSTRIGGVSAGPFASLNLGNPSDSEVKDSTDNIAQNYRRLHAAIDCANRARCFVHQVHGCTVAETTGAFQNGQPADALTSDDPTKVLAIRTADCIPILICTDNGRCVAAIHAGWRGIVAQIIPHAGHEVLRMAGSAGAELLAAIGPCISAAHFEVGLEVIAQFRTRFDDSVIRDDTHVDLPRAAYLQLVAAGISRDHIDVTDRCTFRDADEFFSHRRDRGITGRMAALIGAREDRRATP